jgi:arginine decarboxylase-like protein
MRVKSTNDCIRQMHEAGTGTGMVPPTNVQIVTSDGNTVAAHSSVLVIEQLEIEFRFKTSVQFS